MIITANTLLKYLFPKINMKDPINSKTATATNSLIGRIFHQEENKYLGHAKIK